MATVADVYRIIDSEAPFSSCESFDNVGLLIGNKDISVTSCLVTLDVTKETIKEALEKNCELILSHHPVIFHPLRSIPFDSVQGLLLKSGIAVISAHTNFDKARHGLNIALAELLGLDGFVPLEFDPCAGEGRLPSGRMDMEAVIKLVAQALSLKGLRYFDSGRPIEKVFLCCGGGGSYVYTAIEREADLIISGDFKHDQVIDAQNAGLSCIDAGHFETERHFIFLCCRQFGKLLPDVRFIPSETSEPSFIYRTF